MLGCGGRPETAARGPSRPPAPAGPSCEAAFESYLSESAFSGTRAPGEPPPVEAYARILDYGSYFSHCNPPDRAEIKICAAVQSGRARGVTVRTAPRLAQVEACIDRAVRGLNFPAHGTLEVARTFFPAAGTPVWGLSRSDPESEAKVREFVTSAAGAQGDPRRASALCAPTLVVMQRLWDELARADTALEAHGIETRFETRFEPDALHDQRELSMRVFDGAPELEALLGSEAFMALAAKLRSGTVRAAQPNERELAYKLQMVAFPPDASVTIVANGSEKLAVLLSEGRVYWLELLSAWETRAEPAVMTQVSGGLPD